MGTGGYTRQEQPAKGKPEPGIDGLRVSENPAEFLEGNGIVAGEHPDNGKADGDNPSMPTNVPFGTK